ncbi:hypothetical protein SESBI_04040 [Sesbania bispinosa]|nr:hypothetical protein SESBI_04040 [Sesbania bispinosa]
MGPKGGNGAACIDGFVRPTYASRFKVLMRQKEIVRCESENCLMNIKCYMTFPDHNMTQVTFRDETIWDGSYNNIKFGTILVYAIWDYARQMEMQVKINSRILYYH